LVIGTQISVSGIETDISHNNYLKSVNIHDRNNTKTPQ